MSNQDTQDFVQNKISEIKEISETLAAMTPAQQAVWWAGVKAIETAVHTPLSQRTPEQMKLAAKHFSYLAEKVTDKHLFEGTR